MIASQARPFPWHWRVFAGMQYASSFVACCTKCFVKIWVEPALHSTSYGDKDLGRGHQPNCKR